jgi:hypothetical protein
MPARKHFPLKSAQRCESRHKSSVPKPDPKGKATGEEVLLTAIDAMKEGNICQSHIGWSP